MGFHLSLSSGVVLLTEVSLMSVRVVDKLNHIFVRVPDVGVVVSIVVPNAGRPVSVEGDLNRR